MSLLIEGMDMPKLDEKTEHLWVPGWIEVGEDGKAIFCTGTHFDPNTIRSYPIEEVPTPHGDLIDRDELASKLIPVKDAQSRIGQTFMEWLIALIEEKPPTIIEAEGKS